LRAGDHRYPLSNYTFGQKGVQPEDDPSVEARMLRIENEFHLYGMRRTVEAILLCHDHGHPHILLLQIGGSFFKLYGVARHRPRARCVSDRSRTPAGAGAPFPGPQAGQPAAAGRGRN